MAPRAALLALLASVVLLGFPATAPPTRAADGVEVGAVTTYALRPEARAVHVTVRSTVRNVTQDTARTRFYYLSYTFAVHPDAVKVRATRAGAPLKTTVRREKDTQRVSVAFGIRLYRGQRVTFQVDYDLPDAGAGGKGQTRAGAAFAAFTAYAFGEERAGVRVVLPAGFRVLSTQGKKLASSRGRGGTTVLADNRITEPDRWATWIAAERPEGFRSTPLSVFVGGASKPLQVDAWPEDETWASGVSSALRHGLPVMADLVGLPWRVKGPLRVREVYSPLLGGYAGFYDEAADEIRVTDKADVQVVLHEASHAWFNGSLFRERWINEGLADEYAARALARQGAQADPPGRVERGSSIAFPLNDWPAPDTSTKGATAARREAYGYDASWSVVRQIVTELGTERMRTILRAAARREIAYLGAGPAESRAAESGTADWRELLDLLEERAGSRRAEPLFERWAVGPEEQAELTDRATTRALYVRLQREAGSWSSALPLRQALARWRFAEARDLMAQARTVLMKRDDVEALARRLEMKATGALEAAYEASNDNYVTANSLADEQLQTLASIDRAQRVSSTRPDAITALGLLGTPPSTGLADAAGAYGRDDLGGARAAARRAMAALDAAAEIGRARLWAIVGAALLVLALLIILLLVVLRRRRHRRGTPRDGRAAPVTLAATSRGEETGAP